MLEFAVIDLYSQIDAIRDYTRHWSHEDIVYWLRFFGNIDEPDPQKGTGTYGFRSNVGLTTLFHLDSDNGLSVIKRDWC